MLFLPTRGQQHSEVMLRGNRFLAVPLGGHREPASGVARVLEAIYLVCFAQWSHGRKR